MALKGHFHFPYEINEDYLRLFLEGLLNCRRKSIQTHACANQRLELNLFVCREMDYITLSLGILSSYDGDAEENVN